MQERALAPLSPLIAKVIRGSRLACPKVNMLTLMNSNTFLGQLQLKSLYLCVQCSVFHNSTAVKK